MCNDLSTGTSSSPKGHFWQPCDIVTSNCDDGSYAILILNTPIEFKENYGFLLNLWQKGANESPHRWLLTSQIRITVDGGTDYWISWLKLVNLNFDKIQMPDLVTGDMDSVSQNTLNYFSSKSVTKVIKTPSQYETDFTKALEELNQCCIKNNCKVNSVYAIVDSSGRIDQIMANINTLFKAKNLLPIYTNVFLIASNSISWLLQPGKHCIKIPRCLTQSQEWCSLIPIGEACCVSTTGLKWNLVKGQLQFGQMVSTSNTYEIGSNFVTVETDRPVLWSMGIKSLLMLKKK